jgi:hypothetical protein
MAQIKCPNCDGRGWIEQPDYTPPPDWEDEAYLVHYPDVKKAGANPLAHWFEHGKTEGRSSAGYIAKYKDIREHPYYSTHPLEHYWRHGKNEGRTWGNVPVPPAPQPPQPPGPPASGEIKDFQRMAECDNPVSIYFSSCKVDGKMHFGEYGLQGAYTAKIIRYPHAPVQEFLAESVFDICEFKGSWYCSLEHGGYPDIDRGMVMRWNGSKWVEVFHHPSWILAFHLHVHGDHLYVTGSEWAPMHGGIWRTSNGVNWEQYAASDYTYWDMASGGTDLWTSGAYGGDYGPGCHPAVFRNRDLAWESDEQGAGFLGIATFRGKVYVGQAAPAKVIRINDNKTVVNLPTQGKIPKLIVDDRCNTLYAIGCVADEATRGAEVWKTTDGDKWSLALPPFSVPHLFHAYQDPADGTIYLAGGKWSQGGDGYGRIYKSIRG